MSRDENVLEDKEQFDTAPPANDDGGSERLKPVADAKIRRKVEQRLEELRLKKIMDDYDYDFD